MASSLRDVVKALHQKFTEPNLSTPLPEDLEQILSYFANAHSNSDEAEAQRLHTELMGVFNNFVVGNSEKHPPFVAVLRILRPVIRGEHRLDEWWELVIRPTIDSAGQKRDTVEDAKEFLLSVMDFDAAEASDEQRGISQHFLTRLIGAYFERTKIPSGDESFSQESEFIAHELEAILVRYGQQKPKELLITLDSLLVDRDRRLQCLSLLSDFVRQQTPGLHLVLETNLINSLYMCLLNDNSSTVIDLALTILIMFIPHIASVLVSDLSKLLLIFARVLCWDQYQKEVASRAAVTEGFDMEYGLPPESSFKLDSTAPWDVMPPGESDHAAPKAIYFFTFLYGIFPLNLMAFIRRPRRYLKMKGWAQAEDLELYQELIQSRTEPLRRQHQLHPSFFTMTLETELEDNKVLKSDPAELVTKCLGLCNAVAFNLNDPGPPPTAKLPRLPKLARKKSSRYMEDDPLTLVPTSPTDFKPRSSFRNTQSTTLTNSSINQPMDIKIPPRQSSHVSLAEQYSPSTRNASPHRKNAEDVVESPTGDFDFGKLGSSAPPSPPMSTVGPVGPKQLQSFAQVLSRFPTPSHSVPGGDAYNAALQSQIMLLKNDLSLERFQKQKYMEQLTLMQKRYTAESSVETDSQSLMNKTRALNSKLTKTEELYEQLKKETTTSRSQSKKFEEQQTSRIKALREEERGLKAEVHILRHDLEIAHRQCEDLKKMIIDTERRESDSKNELNVLENDLEEMATLRAQVYELSMRIHEFELRKIEFERAQEEQGILQKELETAHLKLQSSDAELERKRREYEQKIFTLENASRNAQQQQAAPGNVSKSLQQMIDSALAASQNKVAQLKKTNASLQHRCLDLELRCQELEGNGPRPGSVLSLTRFADDMSISSGALSPRDSMIAASPAAAQVPRAKSVRGLSTKHDFAMAAPLIEEDYSTSTMGNASLQSATAQHMGLPHPPLPHPFASPSSSAQHSLTPSPSTTAPPSRYGTMPMENEILPAHMQMAVDSAATHDFQIGPSVTDSLTSPRGLSSLMDASIKATQSHQTRAYGRGGAGNFKKPSEKKKESKIGGFRIKGIM